jgi:hypothetical protein
MKIVKNLRKKYVVRPIATLKFDEDGLYFCIEMQGWKYTIDNKFHRHYQFYKDPNYKNRITLHPSQWEIDMTDFTFCYTHDAIADKWGISHNGSDGYYDPNEKFEIPTEIGNQLTEQLIPNKK